MKISKVEYFAGKTSLEATVVFPEEEEKRGVILLFHPWGGKGAFMEKKAQDLAKMGYIGCALDLYGGGIFTENKEECAALMNPLLEDRALLRQRVLAYRDLLEKINEANIGKVGAIGYCFGGLAALDLARAGANIQGVVSFHGLLHPPKGLLKEKIKAKIQVMHGHKDPMVSKEALSSFCDEMEESSVCYEVHIFGGAMHAFTNPAANDPVFGTVYQKKADEKSWTLMELFFKEAFKS